MKLKVNKGVFNAAMKGKTADGVGAVAGISPSVIESIGKGTVPEREPTRKKVARVLQVDVDKLFIPETEKVTEEE